MQKKVRRRVGCCWLGALLASLPASAQSQDDLPDGSTRMTLRFPRGLGMSDVVLLADGSLRLGRGVAVNLGKEGRGMVANLGKGATAIGDGAKVGTVVAIGPVRVATGAQITGDVRGAGSVDVAAGAKVSGEAHADALLLPFVESSWTIPAPGKADSDVLVANHQTKKLVPGTYRTVTVHDSGVLQLSRGNYFVGSLKVGNRGRIEHQGNEYWPVVMYVSGAVELHGKVGKEKGPTHFLLVTRRVRQLAIGQFFSGTVLAPNARLVLGGKGTILRGGFVGRDIEVVPGTVLEPSPFALDTFRWKGWVAHKDDDRDRVPDYLDACPADEKNTHPAPAAAPCPTRTRMATVFPIAWRVCGAWICPPARRARHVRRRKRAGRFRIESRCTGYARTRPAFRGATPQEPAPGRACRSPASHHPRKGVSSRVC